MHSAHRAPPEGTARSRRRRRRRERSPSPPARGSPRAAPGVPRATGTDRTTDFRPNQPSSSPCYSPVTLPCSHRDAKSARPLSQPKLSSRHGLFSTCVVTLRNMQVYIDGPAFAVPRIASVVGTVLAMFCGLRRLSTRACTQRRRATSRPPLRCRAPSRSSSSGRPDRSPSVTPPRSVTNITFAPATAIHRRKRTPVQSLPSYLLTLASAMISDAPSDAGNSCYRAY